VFEVLAVAVIYSLLRVNFVSVWKSVSREWWSVCCILCSFGATFDHYWGVSLFEQEL